MMSNLRQQWDKNTGCPITLGLGALLLAVAGILYSLHIRRPLDSSEAYTALAADQAGPAAVVRVAMRFDPGKPPLYQLMLHGLALGLGKSEVTLRAPSTIAATATVALLWALGGTLFEPSIGLAAALMWAVNPLAIIFAEWARAYALTIALSLAQLLALWKLRGERWSPGMVITCALLGAAMLYTHLCTALILGAETAMLAGSAWRGERASGAWLALGLALAAFVPYLPVAADQMNTVVRGHLYDWMGYAGQTPLSYRALACAAGAAAIGALAFAPRLERDDREPIRWCAGIALIPAVLLLAGSVVVRPMFAIRYVSPSVAIAFLLLARGLAALGARAFRLSTVGIAAFMAFLYPCYGWYEPWRDIARIVASGSPEEPVFFEPIFTDSNDPLTDHGQGFPQGFLRPAFDHYFSGPNPRRAVDPSRPEQARRIIAQAAAAARGAWLVTTSDEQTARAELPTDCFRVERAAAGHDATLLHITPLRLDHCSKDR